LKENLYSSKSRHFYKIVLQTDYERGIKPIGYCPAIKVTDIEMNVLNLTRDDFHGEWNYSIKANKNR